VTKFIGCLSVTLDCCPYNFCMNEKASDPSVSPEKSDAQGSPLVKKEAWQRPTLESLDVAKTQNTGLAQGGDAASALS
jgi:hypothetical protein